MGGRTIMILLERNVAVMKHSSNSTTLTVVIPKDWCNHHDVESTKISGKKMMALGGEILILIPPKVWERKSFDYKKFKKWVIDNL